MKTAYETPSQGGKDMDDTVRTVATCTNAYTILTMIQRGVDDLEELDLGKAGIFAQILINSIRYQMPFVMEYLETEISKAVAE